jgi:hypothetical protein
MLTAMKKLIVAVAFSILFNALALLLVVSTPGCARSQVRSVNPAAILWCREHDAPECKNLKR